MTAREPDPAPTPRCPECQRNDRSQDATDRERAQFHKPYWCLRCNVAFSGSLIEAQNWRAAKDAAAAERGEIATTNRRGATSARPMNGETR